MFIEVSDAACHNFESPFKFVAIEVDKESAMCQVVGRDGPKEIGIVVVFVIAVDCSPVQPGEVINRFQDQFITGVDLMQNLAHGAGGVLRVAEASFEDIQDCFRLGGNISHAPFVSAIEFQFYPIFVYFVDIVEVGLSVFVVDIGNRLELFLIGPGKINISIYRRVDFHILEDVLIGGLKIFEPFHNVFLNDKQPVEHFIWGYI